MRKTFSWVSVNGRFTTGAKVGSLEKALLAMVLLQDSTSPEKIVRSSPDLKGPKNKAPGAKGRKDRRGSGYHCCSLGPPTHGDNQALHKRAPGEPGDHQATHRVTR